MGILCSHPTPRFWDLTTEDLTHVVPVQPPTNPRVLLHAPACPHVLLGHCHSKLGPQDWCGLRTLPTYPQCGRTHSSGGLGGLGWRVTSSLPVSYLFQVRPRLQDSMFGGPGCPCASGGPRLLALARSPGKTRPSHRILGRGLERRHLRAPAYRPWSQPVLLPSPCWASAPPIAKGMKWQAVPLKRI